MFTLLFELLKKKPQLALSPFCVRVSVMCVTLMDDEPAECLMWNGERHMWNGRTSRTACRSAHVHPLEVIV